MSHVTAYHRIHLGKGTGILGAALAALLTMGYRPAAARAEQPPTERQRAAADLVSHALRYEADGQTAERNELLKWALEKTPDYAPALWHSGFVRFDNRWVKADDVPQLASARKSLASYNEQRQKCPQNVDGQLQLANWCAKNGLRDQERAHLTKVLELDANDAVARKRLHYVMLDGVWRSEDELRGAGAQADRTAASLKKWSARLKPVEKLLAHADARSLAAAAERLQSIQDPEAIPALEQALATVSQESAQLLIDALGRMKSPEAALALARQSISTEWSNVREEAAEKLKAHHEDEYMPALLSAMYTPIQSKTELYQSPDGRLVYTHSFWREGQDHKELAVYQTSISRIRRALGNAELTRERAVMAAQQIAAVRDALRDGTDSKTQEQNARVCEVLAMVTDQNLPASPQAWWQWWNDHNEVFVASDKPLQQTFQADQMSIVDLTPPAVSVGTLDCLAAGTPVWTATGPVAIDQIKSGDLVLSQNPETGELAYKPVLRTTVRPSGKLVKIVAGKDTIQSSGGHTFWVDRTGWVKARKLEAGAQVHDVGGASMVESVEQTNVEERTYNLIVADFHTYFVGQERMLSHDNTVRKAVNATAVGLPNR